MEKLNLEILFAKFRKDILSYLYMFQIEFHELNEFIHELKNLRPFKLDTREATKIQNALNTTIIISYARNFKSSHGFNKIQDVNKILTQDFTREEDKFHKDLINRRDREFAHSDSLPTDLQIDPKNFLLESKRVTRQLLDKNELIMISQMVKKIRNQIDLQIEDIIKLIKTL